MDVAFYEIFDEMITDLLKPDNLASAHKTPLFYLVPRVPLFSSNVAFATRIMKSTITLFREKNDTSNRQRYAGFRVQNYHSPVESRFQTRVGLPEPNFWGPGRKLKKNAAQATPNVRVFPENRVEGRVQIEYITKPMQKSTFGHLRVFRCAFCCRRLAFWDMLRSPPL